MKQKSMFENPLTHKMLWVLGLSAAAVATGGVAYAATRSPTAPGGSGTDSPGNPIADGPTQQAVATIVLGFENGASGTPINLCQAGSAAVTAFQNAWNTAIQGNSAYTALPTTGLYDAATAAAAQQVNGSAPSACSSGTSS